MLRLLISMQKLRKGQDILWFSLRQLYRILWLPSKMCQITGSYTPQVYPRFRVQEKMWYKMQNISARYTIIRGVSFKTNYVNFYSINNINCLIRSQKIILQILSISGLLDDIIVIILMFMWAAVIFRNVVQQNGMAAQQLN